MLVDAVELEDSLLVLDELSADEELSLLDPSPPPEDDFDREPESFL